MPTVPRDETPTVFTFQLQVEGATGFFTEVGGLGSENEVIEQKGGDKSGIRKVPGALKWNDIALKRGVTTNADLYAEVATGRFRQDRSDLQRGRALGLRAGMAVQVLDRSRQDDLGRRDRLGGVRPGPEGHPTGAIATAPNPYDEVPYPGLTYSQTHPGRMATIATLLGMDPPAPARARVLELGCANALNLIAMAGGLPDAEFVGIDSSEREVQEACETIAAIGRGNVSVHHRDLRDIGASDGTFDYVIAHGLYSWIPEDARLPEQPAPERDRVRQLQHLSGVARPAFGARDDAVPDARHARSARARP